MRTEIYQCKLEVCCACQNNCMHCAHGQQMRLYPNYHIELAQLKKFLEACKKSGYFIKILRMHGPGEPLLWKYLEAGLAMIKSYDCIGSVYLTTNGILLPSLSDAVIEKFDVIYISEYVSRSEAIQGLIDKYPTKITVLPKEKFTKLPTSTDRFDIPSKCNCPGPMLFGDNIFLHCGPPVFGAAELMGVDILSRHELYTAVEPGWYEKYVELNLRDSDDKPPIAKMDLCQCCWANYNNFTAEREVTHSMYK